MSSLNLNPPSPGWKPDPPASAQPKEQAESGSNPITTASAGSPTGIQHAQAAIFVVLGAAIGSLLGNHAIMGWLAVHEFVGAFVQAAITGMGVYTAYYVPKPTPAA
jgi:hypothetical protein